MKKNHLSLYLKKFAEAKALEISAAIECDCPFKHVLVIPAYDENIEFLEKLNKSVLSQNALLIILVINQPDNIAPTQINQQLWQNSSKMGDIISKGENYHFSQWPNTQSCLVAVNCFSLEKRLPPKQGVGLARKIGCDIAIALIESQDICSQWIHTTDADTQLPDDYFTRSPKDSRYSAAIYPFKHHSTLKHQSSNEILEATLLYEASLQYYVDGLTYAKSIYAHHSLGSCITVNAIYYAQARGFPKRAGGEDFYLLNKLKKLADIKQLDGTPLLISARASNRAPFGTGPAVNKIIEDQLSFHTYLYYNPKVFEDLRRVICHFTSLFSAKTDTQAWLNQLPEIPQNALKEVGIQSLLTHVETQIKNESQCTKHTSDWFDAFKTLKFIHYLGSHYERIALDSAIDQLAISSDN
ncbi:MAG: hypothetical protein ACRBBR_06185 [Cellvibrionaceae bacterium]